MHVQGELIEYVKVLDRFGISRNDSVTIYCCYIRIPL